MKTNPSPLLMLSFGLSVGVLVGYSFNDKPVSQAEGDYLKEREALVSGMKSLAQQSGLSKDRDDGKPVLQFIRLNISLPEVDALTPKVPNQQQELPVKQNKDLFDQRYQPPQIELPN